ncbi:MAG: formate/nitrite transporter family protein [Clostridia bacterium]|nr:formate/nitrite transporter family protein [Clostridia bacterium]
MVKKVMSGICAGILISIGGTVYLACDNKYIGAILFSVALLCICIKGYSLFTGKIGFIPEKHGKEELSVLFLGLLGNFLSTALCGIVLNFALSDVAKKANVICNAKLTQNILSTFIRAIFCGILMYLAVSIYRDSKRIVGILFCIPVFILSGFEHSIADMFYFAVGNVISLRSLVFILTVILGNTVGGMLLPVINSVGKNNE